MRRFLWGLWKVDLALILAVVIALCVVWNPSANDNRGNNGSGNAAQTNLQTALTGATSFLAANHESYLGIDGGPQLLTGVSPISKIDIGITFIPARVGSTGPDIISIFAPSRSVLVMTAYSKAMRICWGIGRATRSLAHPFLPSFPSTANAGTYYFRAASASPCSAATATASALSTSGFPAA